MGLRLRSVIAAAVVAAAASPAMATLVTDDGGYAGPFIDLSSRAGIVIAPDGTGYTFGPVDLPGMVFTRSQSETNSTFGAVLGQGGYNFTVAGGLARFNGVFAGLDGAGGYMQFTLTGAPVSEFGAFVNYAPDSGLPDSLFGGNPYIAALGANGQVLDNEIYDLGALAPVSASDPLTPFSFRGVSRAGPDIYGLRLGNAFIVAAGSADGSVPTGGPAPVPAVPEPQTYALMLAGLGAVAFMSRRRRTERT